MRKGIMSLEDNLEAAGVEIVDVPVADVTDFVESAEAPMIEMNEAAAEVDAIAEDMEEAATTADVLTDMVETAENSLPEGGLDPAGAEVLTAAVEHLCAKLGFSQRKLRVFASEGFSDKSTRVQSTKLAIEGITDRVKDIWKSIVNAFKSAVAWVKEFFAKYFTTLGRLKERAVGLKATVESLKQNSKEAPKDAAVESDSVAKALHVGGKVPDGATITKLYNSFATSNFATDIDAIVEAGLKACEDTLKSGGKNNKYQKAAIKGKKIALPEGQELPQGYEGFGEVLPFGDKVAVLLVPTEETTLTEKVKALFKSKAYIGKVKGGKEAPTGVKLPVLTTGQMSEVCDGSVKTIDALIAGKKFYEARLTALNAFIKDAEKASNDASEKTAEEKQALAGAAASSRALVSLGTSSQAQYNSYVASIEKAMLDYVAGSIKQYK
jgi:phiKZ-like phage internal head proteins